MRAVAGLLVVCLVALSAAPPAWALGAEVDTVRGVSQKLFRGVVNLVTGWMEIPKNISITWQESGPAPGMTWGFAKGLGLAAARTVVGAFEIVTFPTPITEGYQPIMHPEFVFENMQARGREEGNAQ